MLRRKATFVLGSAALVLVLAAPAFPQRRGGGGAPNRSASVPKASATKNPQPAIREHELPIEQFTRMSPAEREQALAKLPPDRREKLQQQLQQYDRMTPAQREQLDRFRHLPPGQQEAFRKAFKKFQDAPPDRQQAMKEEVGRLRMLPGEERQARLSSHEFRKTFSKDEQHIVGEMVHVLPPNP